MRGSRDSAFQQPETVGIIPAHAGLTLTCSGGLCFIRDHPRACGAHTDTPFGFLLSAGSSPRMRGSPQFINGYFSHPGIIPAHAGLTLFFWSFWSFTRDHPRACGAHSGVKASEAGTSGSSPRMRGSPACELARSWASGIIPAHAGLTRKQHGVRFLAGDHPRACGAHHRMISGEIKAPGSSPRMRGSHSPPPFSMIALGIIPAHAGLT